MSIYILLLQQKNIIIMFQRSSSFLCFSSSSSIFKSSPILLFHHQPKLQRSKSSQNQRRRTRTTFAEHDESSSIIQPSKFFTSDLVQQHQRNVANFKKSSTENDELLSTNSLFDQDDSATYRKSLDEDSDKEYNATAPSAYESRGQQPHIKGRILTESRNPLDTLPSARLLKKMNYFEALKATSVDELSEDDFERHGSSREAATVRLQSHAHHDKLMFRQHSTGAEKEDPRKAHQKPMFRCQRCFHLFKFAPRRVGNNSLDETRAIKNGFKKDKLFFELEAKYRKRGVIVGSRSLSADPTRVNEATCPKCGSGKTESLMQYLHVRNNARKT